MTEILYRCKRQVTSVDWPPEHRLLCAGEVQTVKVWEGLLEGNYHFRGKCSKCGEFYYDCDAFGLQRILTDTDGKPLSEIDMVGPRST